MKLRRALWVTTLAVTTLALLLFAAACTPRLQKPAQNDRSLTVLAAASLVEAFKELGTAFEAHHAGVQVIFNFAGSQQLAQQIAGGAAADVFASASEKDMHAALQTGRVDASSPRTFTRNRLVVIVSPGGNVAASRLADLGQPGLKLVMAAAEVPAGRYSLEFLEKAAADPDLGPSFRAAVLANVVSYEDNVRAVLTKVTLGEADAGIVYASDAAGEKAGGVRVIEIPEALNVTAVYPIAALNDGPQPELAQAFIDLALSPEGQEILAKYGFLP